MMCIKDEIDNLTGHMATLISRFFFFLNSVRCTHVPLWESKRIACVIERGQWLLPHYILSDDSYNELHLSIMRT